MFNFFKNKDIKKEPYVATYAASFLSPDVSSFTSIKDWNHRFIKLMKKAEVENIKKKYKFIKELDRDLTTSTHNGQHSRDLTLTVLFTDDSYEGLEDSSRTVIEDLFQEIENLGGGASLLVHPNEAIRKSYEQRMEVQNNLKEAK
jgi:hypothetical protein